MLCQKLELTRVEKYELSDIVYEEGIVEAKNYEEEGVYNTGGGARGLAIGAAMGAPAIGLALGTAISRSRSGEEFKIKFKGDKVSFDLDDEKLYRKFKVGDRIKLGYRNHFIATFDYTPPNFDKMNLLEKRISHAEFVSAEKI